MPPHIPPNCSCIARIKAKCLSGISANHAMLPSRYQDNICIHSCALFSQNSTRTRAVHFTDTCNSSKLGHCCDQVECHLKLRPGGALAERTRRIFERPTHRSIWQPFANEEAASTLDRSYSVYYNICRSFIAQEIGHCNSSDRSGLAEPVRHSDRSNQNQSFPSAAKRLERLASDSIIFCITGMTMARPIVQTLCGLALVAAAAAQTTPVSMLPHLIGELSLDSNALERFFTDNTTGKIMIEPNTPSPGGLRHCRLHSSVASQSNLALA